MLGLGDIVSILSTSILLLFHVLTFSGDIKPLSAINKYSIHQEKPLTLQYNEQHHDRRGLLNSFHNLNGGTFKGFHPQTQKVESPCTA